MRWSPISREDIKYRRRCRRRGSDDVDVENAEPFGQRLSIKFRQVRRHIGEESEVGRVDWRSRGVRWDDVGQLRQRQNVYLVDPLMWIIIARVTRSALADAPAAAILRIGCVADSR